MIADAPLLPLLAAASCLALMSGAVLWRVLPASWIAACVAIRFAIPVAYFAWFADGTWTLLDDVAYLQQGLVLLDSGFNPVTALFSRAALGQFTLMSRGPHILYGWFNLLAVSVAGPYYFAPVLGNVFLTFVSARVLWSLAGIVGFGPRYRTALAAFFVLHWDVLAWSSFVNMKDNVIVLLTLLLMRALVRFEVGLERRQLLVATALAFVFLWIRFYVPVLIGCCLLVRSALTGGIVARHRLAVLVVAVVGLSAGIWFTGPLALALIETRLELAPASLLVGIARMLLGPQPWAVTRDNDFLLLPSILHLAFFVPGVAGGVLLWRRCPPLRLPLLYTLVILFFFAAFPAQQGPRHRYQVVFMVAWAQFTFLWEVARAMATTRQPLPALPGGTA